MVPRLLPQATKTFQSRLLPGVSVGVYGKLEKGSRIKRTTSTTKLRLDQINSQTHLKSKHHPIHSRCLGSESPPSRSSRLPSVRQCALATPIDPDIIIFFLALANSSAVKPMAPFFAAGT